mgnify:FL=1
MIAKDYCYKGGTTMVTRTDAYTSYDFQDEKNTDTRVRFVGTDEEIEILHKKFMNENKYLYLNEVYPYEVPKKGTYWHKHHCWGTAKEYKEIMEKTSLKLKEYNNKYKQVGSFIAN